MKRIPKTPVEFDYDLWTTEDGKCMVRVKITGEVTEVDREVMKILRVEEKRVRRSYGTDDVYADEPSDSTPTLLSLDAIPAKSVRHLHGSWIQVTLPRRPRSTLVCRIS